MGVSWLSPRFWLERVASAERTPDGYYRISHRVQRAPPVRQRPETDQGLGYPTDYWYAIGRDNDLEKDLAAAIERRLHG